MLNPQRALSLNADSGRPLPRIQAFEGPAGLYAWGCTPRHGEVIMIAGRSGTQKSGLALFWVDEMDLPTIYFSADMSPFTASSRLASKRTGRTTTEVETALHKSAESRKQQLEPLSASRITFSFDSPITWRQVDHELEAYVELWDRFPEVMVFDNLMDFEGAESGYAEQMETMSLLTELARETGATVFILHHATDKSGAAIYDPTAPPSRDQVKGGLSEKPELSLSVALDNQTHEYRIGVIKQRMGPNDPTARRYARMQCEPEYTRFRPLNTPHT